MPITFRVAPATKIIQTRATGIVNLQDLVRHLQVKERQRILAYPEVFDTRGAQFDLSIIDIGRLVDEVRRAMSSTTPGPVAVVTNSNFIRGLARAYASLTINDNPSFEIFDDVEEARSWITRAATASTPGPLSESSQQKSSKAPPATSAP